MVLVLAKVVFVSVLFAVPLALCAAGYHDADRRARARRRGGIAGREPLPAPSVALAARRVPAAAREGAPRRAAAGR